MKNEMVIALTAAMVLLVCGCGGPGADKAGISSGTHYRLIQEVSQSISWEGLIQKGPAFESGKNLNRLEMDFHEDIVSTDQKGNVVKKITILGLKYNSIVRNTPLFSFDSAVDKDPANPLVKLPGQSYTIKTADNGTVVEVKDLEKFKDIGSGSTTADTTAKRLVSEEAIKERHGMILLPGRAAGQLKQGQTWSDIKNYPFGKMGTLVYERIYTVKGITGKVADIDMKGIPSSENADEIYKQQQGGDFAKGFDNTVTYTGQLKIDLVSGKVKAYSEKLQSDWVSIKLPTKPGETGSVTLKMGAVRTYELQKIPLKRR
ncbi:MAG: hypothetical protein E4H40_00440 [Candidatus Brocadiia bacterium]|nr:MAG: hypothetical protein E4H40_00440 [Candidatus Brocadiia bacterium]